MSQKTLTKQTSALMDADMTSMNDNNMLSYENICRVFVRDVYGASEAFMAGVKG